MLVVRDSVVKCLDLSPDKELMAEILLGKQCDTVCKESYSSLQAQVQHFAHDMFRRWSQSLHVSASFLGFVFRLKPGAQM
jgi:hypothetical protein